MPKRIIPLTEMKIRKAKPKENLLSYLTVVVYFFWSHIPVVKLWRFKYRYDGNKNSCFRQHILK